MDDIRIYSRALGSNEVTALYLDSAASAVSPANFTAAAGNAQTSLAWSPVAGVTGYDLKRALQSGGPYVSIATLYGTSYTDSNVTNGATYYYVIAAMNSLGDGTNSMEVSATPSLAASLTTWFAANAINGLANGSVISNWPDISGNGDNATQANPVQQPVYLTNAIAGLPVVHFNSANSNYLAFARPVQDDFTIFCVFRSTQGYGAGSLYYEGAGLVNGEVAGVTDDFGTCLFTNGQVCAGTGDPDVAVTSNSGFNDGKPHLMTFRRTELTGEVDLYVDGIFQGSVTGSMDTLQAPTQLVLGAQQTMINFLNGDLAEIKIFSSALADSDRLVEEAELECKYGITNAGSTPVVPAGLTGIPGNRSVLVSWQVSSGAASYNLSRSTNAGGPFTLIAGNLAANHFVDTNAVSGQMNYYVVAAQNECNASAASPAAGVFLPAPALMIANGGNNSALAISWPGWAGGWSLYSATNLNPPVVWSPVTNAVGSNNGQFNVSLPVNSSGTRFFRLSMP